MGMTFSHATGWGIVIPEDVEEHIHEHGFSEWFWEQYKRYPNLVDDFAYAYDESCGSVVFARSTLTTQYGFGVYSARTPPLPTAQELIELRDLQHELGFDAELEALVVTSYG